MFMIDGCLHRYCFSCMKQHVEVKLLNGKISHCPHENCNSEVPLESCKSLLEPKFVDIVIQRLKEAALPPTEKVYGPYPRCSALMSKKEVMDSSANYLNDPKLVGMSKCTKCRKRFCRKCMVPWHRNMRCKDYQLSTAYIYRCGYEFCYKCGAEWKNKKAMCSCPLWSERNKALIRFSSVILRQQLALVFKPH
uniref:RBR-type E3 ubiquitin transferase n=1 Tax=Kalanchoe fedtschenkoi TaxID=63787 RepID=A0A7N0VCH0_KALFE